MGMTPRVGTHLLMTLVSPMGRRHEVMQWKDYGVVVPSLWTTNGNIRFVAQQVWNYVHDEEHPYTVVESILPDGSFASEEALRQALETFYKLHNPQA